LKDLQKYQSILFVLFTMALIVNLAMFDSVAFKGSILPVFNINLSQAKERATGSDANIDRISISQEVQIVKDESSKSTTQNSDERHLVLQAKEDLAHRLSIKVDKVKLLELRAVTWPDSSLGCPKAGEVYDQVPQNGFLIRLEAEGSMYFYHSDGTLNPFFCEETSRIVPHPGKGDEFIPKPGIEID
jgi:hypothetical protein